MGYTKWNINSVRKLLKEKGYILIDKEYKNFHNKLNFYDLDGYYYYKSLKDLIKNPPNKFCKSNPYTIQNIKLWCKLNNKPFKLISDTYNGSDKYLKWQCLKENCGEVFENSWGNISSHNGCPYCRGLKIGTSNCLATKNQDIASEWHQTKNGDLTPYDVSYGSARYIWWQCEKGHEWPAKVVDRNNGSGCPYCAGKLPSKDYNLLVNNSDLCQEWDYNKNKNNPEEYTPNSGQYAWWICSECGHSWYATIHSRNSGTYVGCPECSKSKGEKKISEILIFNNWIKISQEEFEKLINKTKYNKNYFISQMKYDGLIGLGNGLLSYDFYIPKYNLLIEFQGEQHEKYIPGLHKFKEDFEKQLEHDRRKREYAEKHNINLLEIWYYDFDNIEKILFKYIRNNSNELVSIF